MNFTKDKILIEKEAKSKLKERSCGAIYKFFFELNVIREQVFKYTHVDTSTEGLLNVATTAFGSSYKSYLNSDDYKTL